MAPIALGADSSEDRIGDLKRRVKTADLAIFPDGLKTSGQHPPLYNQIYPYSAFPQHIEGSTVWRPEDYANNPERWVHQFSPLETEEISRAADEFIASGLPITGITKENFPLPSLDGNLAAMRRELLNGKGFMLFKRGIPVNEWGNYKSAVAYFGLGVHIGYPVSQNRNGHILGHVQSLDVDGSKTDSVRIYKTTARQVSRCGFHAPEIYLNMI
ncbi:hypothetical protein NPX13_g8867 [Xylaria arbuscula]|uniref:TauD/TfdA-like domain-containing protein n=1 Tax=Xylaria arbuscula TaxID=114810 RepID=A0A9W8TJF3_9PEZI|nr:hypothetical protein NPX13_g8867 [Xylaria arbuscula]